MRRPCIAVYILDSLSRRLYVGVTSNLGKRLLEHRLGIKSDFPQRYRIRRLVYYETYDRIVDAIAREKQIKGWRREKKLTLIEGQNAGWLDLGRDLIGKRGW